METTFTLTRRGCRYCPSAVKAINFVNRYLPYDKRIRILDNYEWEEFGLPGNAIINNLDPKSFEGYPYIFIDGVEVTEGVIEWGGSCDKQRFTILDPPQEMVEDGVVVIKIGVNTLGKGCTPTYAWIYS